MKDIELPPLPSSHQQGDQTTDFHGRLLKYTDRDMKAYARAAVEADRAQRVPDGYREVLSNLLWAATERDAKNRIRQFDEFLDAARSMLASTPAQPAQQESSIPAEFDVRTILLSISPGEDGMGHEVYAASVADVESQLTSMGQELEEWQLGIRRLPTAAHQEPPSAPAQPAQQEPMEAFLVIDLGRELGVAASELAKELRDQGIGDYSVNMALPKAAADAMRRHFKATAAHQEPPQPVERKPMTDPCPGCTKGHVCRTPKCGRLDLPVDHPLRCPTPGIRE